MNNSELKQQAQLWFDQGQPCVLVTIEKSQGSTPRRAGTLMLVTARDFAGTIGGGHLELEALALARQLLSTAAPQPFSRHFSLGPSLGQCCGGALDLGFALLDTSHLAHWPEDSIRFELALFGAGHVGQAIVKAMAPLPCKVLWIDEREALFPPQNGRAPNIERRCVDEVSQEVKTLGSGTFVVISTHSHDLDLALCEAALRRPDLPFVGLIGSATKRERFVRRLSAKFNHEGNTTARPETRLICPIGLEGLAGKEPAVIAASLAAQLLMLS